MLENSIYVLNQILFPFQLRGPDLSHAEIYVPHGYNGASHTSYTIPITTNISFLQRLQIEVENRLVILKPHLSMQTQN